MASSINDLTEEQTEELQQLLLQVRDELVSLLSVAEQITKPVDVGQPIGRLTRIDALASQSLARANRQNSGTRLRQVNTALAAVQGGEYGCCRHCDEPIGYARLKARPETMFCLRCQSQSEQGR